MRDKRLMRCEAWRRCKEKDCYHKKRVHKHMGGCDFVCNRFKGVPGAVCRPVRKGVKG